MSEFLKEPKIKLVGRPVVDINGITEFLSDHDMEWPEFQHKLDSNMDLGDRDGEWLCEAAGRTCYMSFTYKGQPKRGRSHEDHIKHLIEVGHGSIFEHFNLNFEIWNISRSLSHELVRHRSGCAISQLSQRYVDSSDVKFIIPPGIQELEEDNPDLYNKWKEFCCQSRQLYEELTVGLSNHYSDLNSNVEKRKKARQAARSVLPNATETKIFWTANGRAIRHVIEMRAHPAADLEIRKLAVQLFKVVNREFPLLTHGMQLIKLEDGTEGVSSEFRKV